MTALIMLWVTWFFAATWLENTAIVCKRFLAKGVHTMRKLGSVFASLMFIAAIFVSVPRPVSAQEQDADPPGRVARLNYTDGSVSYQVSGDSDWVQADPNRPLTTGDNLWVDQNSRGEVHVGSTAIRLSAQTGLSILNLNDQAVQIEVPQGSLELHVRDIADQEAYEVDTPNLAMTILRPGDYRIDVDPDGGSSLITVRSGNAEITAAGTAYNANPGQQYVFAGSDHLTYD